MLEASNHLMLAVLCSPAAKPQNETTAALALETVLHIAVAELLQAHL